MLTTTRLLIIYRWAALILAVSYATADGGHDEHFLAGVAAATAANLLVTLWRGLDALVRRFPLLLSLDLMLGVLLLRFTGGATSPFYAYALSPMLAAAFLFRWARGTVVAAGAFGGLYGLVILASTGWNLSLLLQASGHIATFLLLAGTFGYLTVMNTRLQLAHDELARQQADLAASYQRLTDIYELNQALQAAVEVQEVQSCILQLVTQRMGFGRAILGIVDTSDPAISQWLIARRDQQAADEKMSYLARLPLSGDPGPIGEALQTNRVVLVADGRPVCGHQTISTQLGLGSEYAIVPLVLREHPVGILILDNPDGTALEPEGLRQLDIFRNQAAVALGTTMLCVDRAQRLAVSEERDRIARDVHDTVSQSLFGIIYGLEACIRMLPGAPEHVKGELVQIQRLAAAARAELRRVILNPALPDLGPGRLKQELLNATRRICPKPPSLDVSVSGDLESLDYRLRYGLFAIAREAVMNAVKHSGASQVRVCVNVAPAEVEVLVRDDGCGFPADRQVGYGLAILESKVSELGGDVNILSKPGAGTTVLVRIPW